MSIILWAAGLGKNWVTSKIGDYIKNAYNDKSFDGQLSSAVEKWVQQHGLEQATSESLFDWYYRDALAEQPFRKELSDTIMKKNQIPSEDLWKGALMERYYELRSTTIGNGYLQSLFEMAPEKALALFEDLSQKLYMICAQNLNLYTVTTHITIQELKQDIERLLKQKPSEETTLALHNFSDFLNNRRVLYLSFVLEENYPLIAMTESVTDIREKLGEVIKKLPVNSNEHRNAVNMQEACMLFNDKILNLRHAVLEDTKTPLWKQDPEIVKIIEKSLVDFRRNFIQPMYWLLTQYKVNIPNGIVRNTEFVLRKDIPSVIYVQGIPARTDKPIHYAGYQEVGYYLRILTLGEDYMIQDVTFPMNTELIFYDPKEVNNETRIWKVTLGNDTEIRGEKWKKGDRFYFSHLGELSLADPVTI